MAAQKFRASLCVHLDQITAAVVMLGLAAVSSGQKLSVRLHMHLLLLHLEVVVHYLIRIVSCERQV